MIKLRRNPWITLAAMAIGVAAAALGLYFGSMVALFFGVLFLFLAALFLLNPAVVISAKTLEIKNLFGVTRITYDHDGLEHLRIQDGKLVLVSKGMQAVLSRVSASHLHSADWKFLESSLEEAEARARRSGKRPGGSSKRGNYRPPGRR